MTLTSHTLIYDCLIYLHQTIVQNRFLKAVQCVSGFRQSRFRVDVALYHSMHEAGCEYNQWKCFGYYYLAVAVNVHSNLSL